MKVVIPMAGLGTRLRPHTWSKPKQLISVAGKAVLDHVLDTLSSLPDPANIELINIVGHFGDQIEAYLGERYPHIKARYVLQEDPRGQSHAIYLAREHLSGPMLMVFADTLIETDLSFLADEPAEAVAWVKPVPDPRRFGVAVLDKNGWVTRLIEKPAEMGNNLAVVGFYYFQGAEDLLSAIEEQMRRGLKLKDEFFLADAINIMLERGLKMRIEKVDVWLDAGTSEALLETNRYLLDNGRSNIKSATETAGLVVIPPVFIHPTAEVVNSVIGPHVSVGAGCRVESSILRDTILEDEAQVKDVILEGSLIGRQAQISRRAGVINAGDQTVVML
ncbi:MAG TPA: sugar phosphate nucleotidyltransferase [Anaerolineales bacterium]|nr:sugar phosphate nucleotidyltransferase [Anaerolineales bacterium]